MKELIEKLQAAGQTRLAGYLETANAADAEKLAGQLKEVDLEELPRLIEGYVMKKPDTAVPDDLTPAPFLPFPPETGADKAKYAEALRLGVELLKQGKVAALTVAGGQGTRLGFDGPKGTFPITPVCRKTLFQYFAESLGRVSEKYGSPVPWFIMTSELNDSATRTFFAENNYFGLDRAQVTFFTQGTMPAIGYDGQLILASPDSLALAPNGHGGTLLALRKSGALDAMKEKGVEYISYFQVDNPLVPVTDPLFIGLHAMEKAEVSCRMLPKTNAYEKLGNFCMTKGHCEIIEYSDMPNDLAEQRREDGTLAFLAGSPAIHVFSRSFVERLTAAGRLELPWHRADKKVAYMDDSGNLVKPESPNAVKLESFIFDTLPLASRVMILEGAREELFAPTKNPAGVDSVESCREMLIARDARRMEAAGIAVPRKADGTPDCMVELSPRSVFDDEDAVTFFRENPAEAPVAGSSNCYGK